MRKTLDLAFNNMLDAVGGPDNIARLEHCMTRLRVNVANVDSVNIEDLKAIDIVKGVVVSGGNLQIILGMGFSNKAFSYFNKFLSNKPQSLNKQGYRVTLKSILSFISSIFTPLIPALIGCGFILGFVNITKTISPTLYSNYLEIFSLLAVISKTVIYFLPVIVGYTVALKSGASPVLGAVIGGALSIPDLNSQSLFNHSLTANSGGVFSVLIVTLFSSWLELAIRKRINENFDLIVTPLVTILLSVFLGYILFQPLGEYIGNGIVYFVSLTIMSGVLISLFSGALLGGGFLFLLLTGLHQSLIPVHTQILHSFGLNYLFPILAMGGMGQVGSSLWVLLKTKNKKLRKILFSAIPVGMLGIGEPLLFGVSLPLGKPLIAGCIGGSIGGATIAVTKVGIIIPAGTAGLSLIPMVGDGKALYYIFGVLIAWIGGFISCSIIGFDDGIIK